MKTYYKRIVIVPYNMASKGAKNLRNALRIAQKKPVLYVPPTSMKYQPRWTDYVINWGNKLNFFKKIEANNKVFEHNHVNIPEWTTDPDIVRDWLADGDMVFARKILVGHSGAGIVIIGPDHNGPLPTAPLYVKYKKKRHEYRVHFAQEDGGAYTVIDVTQKKKRKGFENVDTKIRNHQNGWIYAREDIYLPQDLKTQALNAAFCSALPFGAVDLIWNEKENKSYVLEINSAPGIEGTTLQNYVNFFVGETK